MKVLDLFSGIGGFSLGLERAGMRTAAFCEIEPFCRKVLKKHWLDVPIYKDIRELNAERLRRDGIEGINIIAGGFPCQDASAANPKGEGIKGARTGLWKEFHRLIAEIKPQLVFAENVANLRNRGLAGVLRDLRAIGYDAEWHIVPASAVGAFHRRERLWIIAYPDHAGDRAYRYEAYKYWPPIIAGWPEQPFSEFNRPSEDNRGEGWFFESGIPGIHDGVPDGVDRNRALANSVRPDIVETLAQISAKRTASCTLP